MKKVSLTGIFLSMFVVMGCATDEETESASEETYDITLGHLAETGHHYHEISERFAELVEERTDGNVNVEVYPSDQLGYSNRICRSSYVRSTGYGTYFG